MNLATVATVAVLTTAAAGCSSAPQHRDLFKPAKSSTCIVVADSRKDRTIYLGGYVFRDASGEPVIDHVSLVGANGLTLKDARVVPIVDKEYTALATYTPNELPAWRTAKPAAGHKIVQMDPASELMFGVERTLPIGTASGVRVDYHIGNRAYYAYWPRHIGLVDKFKKCDIVDERDGL